MCAVCASDVSGMCVLHDMYMWYVVCICECVWCVCLVCGMMCGISGVYGICVLCVCDVYV